MRSHNNSRLVRSIHLGSLLAVFWFLAQALPVADASTDISNIPMAVTNTVKPNLMLTIDSSGGMDVDVLLPTYNSMYYEYGVTPGNNPDLLNGMFYLFPETGHDYHYLLGESGNPDPLAYRARDYQYNVQFYDPYKTYSPWPGTDINGTPYANADPANARLDPYDPSVGSVNLTQTITYTAWTYLDPCGVNISTTTDTCNGTPYGPGGRSYSSTLYPASYYVWSDTNNNGLMDPGEGVLYDITPTTATYPSGRSYTDELQNFANWFEYYRTVMLSFKGAIIKQIDTLGGARVGMTDLEHNNVVFPVADMSVPSNAAALKSAIAAIKPNLNDWRQPFHERLYNIAQYYRETGSSAPIQYACQQNFDMLVTPGYLNENGPGAAGFTNYFTDVTPPDISPQNFDGTMGMPYADSYSETLADWAAYYYAQNLRPDLPAGQVPIPPNTHETNTNPHMTIYVLAPGAVPTLSGPPLYLNPATTDPYTVNPSIIWPQPQFVAQTTIDDLWHAAVNGRGLFINSSNIYNGLNLIFSDVLTRTSAAAAVSVSNANVEPGDNFSYSSSYNSGNWSGDLISYPINLTTGYPDTSSPAWAAGSAQVQLDNLNWTSRHVATWSGTAGIPFSWSSLSSAQQSLLDSPVSPPGTTDGQSVLNYLRGDRSGEGNTYRTRAHVLADIINAEPLVVRPPMNNYIDNGYSAFKTANAGRAKMVYQGANDGMLHAFNASTGAEVWAYVPGLLFNSRLAAYPNTSTLVNLSMKTGFTHLAYVDATPVSGDVDFSYTNGNNLNNPPAPNWHTLLVGGLGNGGRGYFALDVTNPSASSDADVAAKALWEFPNSSTSSSVADNIGLSFGKPVIVKTAAAGWVVLVTSGYNNGSDTGGDGQGHLFVLNAATGSLIADLSTGAGSSTNPSGLAQISGFVTNGNIDDTVSYVYGGDLLGNVWRFDLTGNTVNSWTVKPLAQLTDASGNAQPITTAPELSTVNGHHMVYVGTGEYLGNSDIPGSGQNSHATQTQSIYGLEDNLSATPLITGLRTGSLVQQTFSTSGGTRTSSANPVDLTVKQGWYADFPDTGERLVSDPVLASGALIFTTIEPSDTNPCQPGGSSWLYVLDYGTGAHLENSSQPWSAILLGDTLSSRPVLIKLPSGTIDALIRQSNATTTSTQIPLPSSSTSGQRVSWREILVN